MLNCIPRDLNMTLIPSVQLKKDNFPTSLQFIFASSIQLTESETEIF